LKIGILAFQGSFQEHANMLRKLKEKGFNVEPVLVKKRVQLTDIDGIIIPGGESTTIGYLSSRTGVLDELKDKILSGLPTLGTCAGAIFLAKQVYDSKLGKRSQPLLGIMDIEVSRNYYGRQRESFEATIKYDSEIIRGIFIRSPAIIRTWGNAKATSTLGNVIVGAEEGNIIATTFHPELSDSTYIHRKLITLIKK
jgi:5'-phosphate synthase pdxT subunit